MSFGSEAFAQAIASLHLERQWAFLRWSSWYLHKCFATISNIQLGSAPRV